VPAAAAVVEHQIQVVRGEQVAAVTEVVTQLLLQLGQQIPVAVEDRGVILVQQAALESLSSKYQIGIRPYSLVV
jgi:hypothetical protein